MSEYDDAVKHLHDNIARNLSNLELSTVAETDKVKCYRLAKPGTRAYSVQITFTPEGIAIQGDLIISGYGVCSTFGYGLDWFADRLNDDYLCEKFMQREFVAESAIDDLRYQLEDMTDDEKAVAEELIDALGSSNGEEARDDYASFCWTRDCEPSGCDYNIAARATLSAVQERFRELWTKEESDKPEARQA